MVNEVAATEVTETPEKSPIYVFLGQNFLKADGKVVFLTAYFDSVEHDMIEVLAHVQTMGESNGLQAFTTTMMTAGPAVSSESSKADDGSEYEVKKVDTFIRRSQRNKTPKEGQSLTTPIIDIYPAYVRGATGVYGIYPVVSIWLNTDDDVKKFEDATGVVLKDMPLYSSQTAAQRDPDYQAEWEVTIEEPMNIKIKNTPKLREDGTMGKKVRLESWKA